MFSWISFNALYYASTEAISDERSWRKFIEKVEIKIVWESVKDIQEIQDLLEYLRKREVFDKF